MPEAVLQYYNSLNSSFQSEVADFIMYLFQKQERTKNNQKNFDAEYNSLVADMSNVITDSAKATIWEQIKDDTW